MLCIPVELKRNVTGILNECLQMEKYFKISVKFYHEISEISTFRLSHLFMIIMVLL
jgi:hypothetical protein